MIPRVLTLFLITLFAATINGALGYGFSSITVPLALLFTTNRILNPAIVMVEVFMNLVTLVVNRKSISTVWPRLKMILIGILLAAVLGAYLLHTTNPSWIKLWTYVILLPLLFLQVAGIRRPIKIDRAPGVGIGAGVGLLYALTTISGPPLALILNNDGMETRDFRAALGIIRVFESIVTLIAYLSLGLITSESLSLLEPITPSVLIGIPLGAFLIRKVDAAVFRRFCMSFDVLIVAFGLGRVLIELKLADSAFAYVPMALAFLLDAYLLYAFFRTRSLATHSA